MAFSFHLFLSADRCSTDISECQLLVDQEYSRLTSLVSSLLGQITDEVDARLGGLKGLGEGQVLGGWDVVLGTMQHLLTGLVAGRWIADKGGRYSRLPLFRKKLLSHINVQRVNFRVFSLEELEISDD